MTLASRRLLSGFDRRIWEAAGLDIDLPSPSPDAMDDEFAGASLDTGKWSWVNQGSVSASQSESVLTMTVNENTNQIRGIYQSAPSAPWAFDAKIFLPNSLLTESSPSYAALFVGESASAEIRCVGIRSGGALIRTVTHATPSSIASNWGSITETTDRVVTDINAFYFRMMYDGTSLLVAWSKNGRDAWDYIDTLAPAYTPSIVGLGITNRSNAAGWFSFDWFRRTL